MPSRTQRPRVDATDLARNHWRYILTQLGIPEKALSGKHGPCPACGGEDRFRFDNRNGEGSHYCSGCGAGSGYQLLMKVHNWSFKQTLTKVQELISPGLEEETVQRGLSDGRKRQMLRDAWMQGRFNAPGTIEYLTGRGLSIKTAQSASDVLRYGHIYHSDRAERVPAVMGLVQNMMGQPVTIHRTYLHEDGRREKKTMPCVGEMNGCAIRFSRTMPERLVLAEGIETTLAAMEMFDLPGWATLSANGMESVRLPVQVKSVVICADNDAKYAGQKAAYTLAHRLAVKMGAENVMVIMPECVGWDYLDLLNHYKGKDNGQAKKSGEPAVCREGEQQGNDDDCADFQAAGPDDQRGQERSAPHGQSDS